MKVRKFSTLNKVVRRNSNGKRNARRQQQLSTQSKFIPSYRLNPIIPGSVLKSTHNV